MNASQKGRSSQRGSALVTTMVSIVVLFGMIVTTTVLSSVEVRDSRTTIKGIQTKYLAESAVTIGIQYLDNVTDLSPQDPLEALTDLFTVEKRITPFLGVSLVDDSRSVGEYTIALSLADSSDSSVSILIESTGYTPVAPQNLAPGEHIDSWHSLSVTVEYSVEPSEVFDYAYFINNWGWLYGNTIFCNGNARSNGQFDAGGYAPTITGQPIYDKVAWDGTSATLSGYVDDNGDGLEDGKDGGVYSGWDIVNSSNVTGQAGESGNQHDFGEVLEMPNLTDLSPYEEIATAQNSTISHDGNIISDAVYGDDPGERKNILLLGTAANPIELNGPVVIQGDVIIGGYVTGQGAIYASGNVYVPDSLTYVNGPSTPRPTDNTQAKTEEWLTANWDKDYLGLFAAENIVVGDYTDPVWESYVTGWMSSSMNSSEEDAGNDKIPNTSAGKDGISGTADDDILEGDGVFTTEYYTQEDKDYGLIPKGSKVGDSIPETGEDIDGDGQYDDTTTMADIEIDDQINYGLWGGTMTPGVINYEDIASLYADNLDAAFYTNHSFCYVVFGSNTARINGAIISRNENIVYGTPKIEINYDCRMLGGNTSLFGPLLPRTLKKATVLRWMRADRDPNSFTVAP